MTTSDDVYEFIVRNGPTLPAAVAERFGISTLFASAYLSELSSKGEVIVSQMKIGGSPLYYTPQSAARMIEYKDNLHEKEQRTYELLKRSRVVEDLSLELLDRVALRKMKDYAVPLTVRMDGETRLFWKFFLVSDADAGSLIQSMLETSRTNVASTSDSDSQSPLQESSQEEGLPRASPIPPLPPNEDPEPVYAPVPEQRDAHPTAPDISSRTPHSPVQERSSRQDAKRSSVQKTIVQEKSSEIDELAKDALGKKLIAYFSEKGIDVVYAEIARKNNEVFGVLIIPSVIGDLEYFFYAKSKKSITEKDVKEAFAESAILGYPLLYIADGSVAKGAAQFIDVKLKGCIIISLN